MTATTAAAREFRGTDTEGRSEAELQELVRHVGAELELAPAEVILEWAVATFGDRFCVTSSMADAVLAHLASTVAPGIDVVFLDTGYHFAETLGTRDAVEATLPVNLRTVRPRQSVAEQDATHGRDLFRTDPDRCCALRKVAPLRAELSKFDAWITAIRRDQTPERATAQIVEDDRKFGLVKINPLVAWTHDDVWAHIYANDVPTNALHAAGYPSIGCQPCTSPVAPGEDPRSGRWRGAAKTECGLHIAPPEGESA